MPLTPLAGATRLRAFQLGLEGTFNVQQAATRRMPWSITPTVDPHWTFPTADTGTLDQAVAPYRTALDVTAAVSGAQLFANDVPALMCASIKGGVTPSTVGGTGKSWVWQPASTSQDVFDTFMGEVFDDATADAWAFPGGIITDWTLTYPQDLGPIALDATYRFASAVYPATPTGALTTDLAPTPLYMADTALYINDTSGAIGTTMIADTLYDASLSYAGNIDVKRFANGNSVRFNVINYGRGERVFNFMINVTKDAAAVAEAVKWIGASPTERFLELRTTAVPFAGSGQPYSFSVQIPGYWISRAWTTINSNTGFSLTGHQVYDAGLGFPIKFTSVNTQATAV
jgi:hypothetical protein